MQVREVLGQELIALILNKDGKFSLVSEFDLTVSCHMDFANFPFDQHLCPIEISVSDVDIYLEEGVSFENSNDTTEQNYHFKVSAKSNPS